MILIGGYDPEARTYSDSVWKLSSAAGWTRIGTLHQVIFQLNILCNTNDDLFKAVSYGSAIINGNSIYSFGGYGRNSFQKFSIFPIQRLDMGGDGTIEQIEHIGNQTKIYFPIMFITDINTCATT